MDTIHNEDPMPAIKRVQSLIPGAQQGPVEVSRFGGDVTTAWSWWVGRLHGGNVWIDTSYTPNMWQVSVEFYPAGATQYDRNVAQVSVLVDPRGL